MDLKSENTQNAHLGPLLNFNILAQFGGGGKRGTSHFQRRP